MKKILFILLSFFFLTSSFAKEVSLKRAEKIAKLSYFYRLNNYYTPVSMEQLKISNQFTVKDKGENAFYVFNFENFGFIIISAEDAMLPVLGYTFDNPYLGDAMNPNFKAWVGTYKDNINYIREHNITADKFVRSRWKREESIDPQNLALTKSKGVDPLLHSTWNQDNPYNYFCPADNAGPGGRVYAGCVATAMSQIMYYWRWPETGEGSHCYYATGYGQLCADFANTEYQWNGMLDNSDYDPSAPMALLQYHAGVAVNMDYSPDGSGSNSNYAKNAFKNYFKYSNSCQIMYKSSYTYTVWKGYVHDELDDKCPMYYAGFSSDGGHAFVLDGYTDDDEFHFNFGWSGSANGFYTMYDVGGYSTNQQMIRNIFPSASYTYPVVWSGVKNVPHVRGIIEDGSGPRQDYPVNTTHAWLIDPSLDGQVADAITIDFLEMDIANNDMIYIYDGADDSAPLLGSYNGNTPPSGNLTSSQGVMFIKFVSDASGTGDGFRIHYEADQPSLCGSNVMMTDQSGAIDDGSGDMDYVNGKNCSWFIQPPNASKLTINFLDFKTQETYDHLTFYDGTTFAELADFSGEEDIPDSVVFETGKLLMTFKTDVLVADEGWSLTYHSDLVGAEENLNTLSDISLYPNPATDKLSVNFSVAQKDDIQFTIYDIKGAPVYEDKVTGFAGSYHNAIDLSKFAKGVYFVKIISTGRVYTDKLIVE